MHAGHGGVDCEVAALGDAAEDALEGVLEDAAVVGLALLEGMFGEFALGDVDAGALVAENVAGLVTEDVGVEQDPEGVAVLVAEPGLEVVDPVVLGEQLQEAVPVRGVGVDLGGDVGDGGDHLGRGGVAVHTGEGGVDAAEPAVGGGLVDAVDGAFEDGAVLRLAVAKRLLGAFELGDIEHHAFERFEFSVGGEDALALLGDPDLLVGAGLYAVDEPVGSVCSQAALDLAPDLVALRWRKNIGEADTAGEEIAAGDTEQGLAPVADELDGPVPVVGAAVGDAGEVGDERAPAAFLLPQRLLGLFALGDVLGEADQADDGAGLLVEDGDEAGRKDAESDGGEQVLFDDDGAARLHTLAVLGDDLVRYLGREDVVRGVGAGAEQRDGHVVLEGAVVDAFVDETAVGFDAGGEDGVAGVLDDFAQAGFALADGVRGGALGGDVGDDGQAHRLLADGDVASGERADEDGAVLAAEAGVDPVEVAAALADVADGNGAGGVAPEAEFLGGAADDLGAGVSEKAFELLVDLEEDAAGAGGEADGVGNQQEDPGEALLALEQGGFGLPAFGDVAAVQDDAADAGVVQPAHPDGLDGHPMPVLMAVPVFDAVGDAGAAGDRLVEDRLCCGVVVGVDQAGPVDADEFGGGESKDGFDGAVGGEDGAGGVDDEGEVAGVEQEPLEAVFAFAQRGFGLFALGDVEDHDDPIAEGIGGVDQSALEQHIDDGAVLATVCRLDGGRAIGGGSAVEGSAGAFEGIVILVEEPWGAPDEFLCGVAEELNDAVVDAADGAFVEDGDADRCGEEEAAHLLFAASQGFLGFPFGVQSRQFTLGAQLLFAGEGGGRFVGLLAVADEAGDEETDDADDGTAGEDVAERFVGPVAEGGDAGWGALAGQWEEAAQPAVGGEPVPEQT